MMLAKIFFVLFQFYVLLILHFPNVNSVKNRSVVILQGKDYGRVRYIMRLMDELVISFGISHLFISQTQKHVRREYFE